MLRWFFVLTAAVAAFLALTVLVGLFLPRLHAVAVGLFLSVPPAEVWDLVADPRGYPRWRTPVDEVELLGSEPERWRERAVTGESVWREEERDAPRRFRAAMTEHELPFLRRWTWELEPEGSGTRVVLTEEGETRHPFYRVLLRFVVGQEAAVAEALRGLRDHFGEA